MKTFGLFADCVLVKGGARSAIYDLTRTRILTFPTQWCSVIAGMDGWTSQQLRDTVDPVVLDVYEFLQRNDVAGWLSTRGRFIPIREGGPSPHVSNSIIDVSAIEHDFPKILSDLDELGCEHLQVRVFDRAFGSAGVRRVARLATGTCLGGIEFMLPDDPSIDRSEFVAILGDYPLIARIVIYGSEVEGSSFSERLICIRDQIESAADCGKISRSNLTIPNQRTFAQAKTSNGCLGGKVSVDALGNIKNCPSCTKSYGSASDTSLASVARRPEFRGEWDRKKDDIDVCRSCEYRYACTDCRVTADQTGNGHGEACKLPIRSLPWRVGLT